MILINLMEIPMVDAMEVKFYVIKEKISYF